MTDRDQDLALSEHLEGLLPPEQAAALEGRLAAEPGLRARLSALDRVLPADPAAPVALPPLPAPPGLPDRAAARALRAGQERLLAEHLEGLLAPDQGAALEADPALCGRLAALRAALPDADALPALAPPAGLFERTLVRLEEEGLIDPGPGALGDALDQAPPAGLLGATLARLEAEALLVPPAPGQAAPAPRGLLLAWGQRRVALAAAGLLLALGAAFQLGSAWQRGPALQAVRDRDAAIDALMAEVARLREDDAAQVIELAETRRRASQAQDALQDARARAASQERVRRELEIALGEEQRVRLELESGATRLEALRAERDALRAERDALLARAPAPPAPQEPGPAVAELASRARELEAALARAQEEAQDLRRDLAEAEERALQAQLAATDLAPSMLVSDARRIDRWDPARREWRPLQGKTELRPGAIVRGAGTRSALELQDRRTFELRGGTYVVTGARGLDPLPDGALRAAPAAQAPAGALRERVPALISLLGSGGPADRAAAQRDLTALWRRFPDPGPGVVSRMTALRQEDANAPPATPQGWEAWWSRVEEQVAQGE